MTAFLVDLDQCGEMEQAVLTETDDNITISPWSCWTVAVDGKGQNGDSVR